MKRLQLAVLVSVLLVPSLVAGCGGGASRSQEPTFRYAVSEIIKLPYSARLVARNKNGFMIGFRYGDDADAFVVSPDGALTMIPDQEGFPGTLVMGINNAGKVVGRSTRYSAVVPQAEATGFVYDILTKRSSRLSGLNFPNAVSDSGKAVGLNGQIDLNTGKWIFKGIVSDINTGEFETLPDAGGDTYFDAVGIDNGGLIVGNLDGNLAQYDLKTKASPILVPAGIYPHSYAKAILANGKVSGIDTVAFEDVYVGSLRGFVYDTVSGNKTYLPELPSTVNYVVSFPINAAGDGALEAANESFAYRNGQVQELSSSLSFEDQKTWQILQTFAIDDDGIIYATCRRKGVTDTETSTYVVRLTPQ